VPRVERVLNAMLGLSVLSWSVMALLQPFAPPRLVIAVLNLVVGLLLVFRSPLVASGSIGALILALPAVLVAGLALKLSAPLESWPLSAELLFAAGGALAVASFAALGRSFAILPALRSIATGGPYRFVRHPAYLGELLMVAACVIAGPSAFTALVAVAALPLVMLRIGAEERLLVRSPSYVEYAGRIRYRLLPGLW